MDPGESSACGTPLPLAFCPCLPLKYSYQSPASARRRRHGSILASPLPHKNASSFSHRPGGCLRIGSVLSGGDLGGTPPVPARSPDHYRQLSCAMGLWVSSAQYGCGMLWTTAWARCDSGPGTSHPPGAFWSVISTDPGRVGRSRTNEEEEEIKCPTH